MINSHPSTIAHPPGPCASRQHFAILGAGLVGRLLAWRLLEAGHAISLFERGDLQHSRAAAHTAAAMISPLSEVVVSDRSIYDMGIASLALWPQWIKALNAHELGLINYQSTGSLALAHAQDLSELEQFHRELNFHLGKDNTAQWLDHTGLAELEPDLSNQFDRALYLPGEAHLDNRQLLKTLLLRIDALGGKCYAHSRVELDNGAYTVNAKPLDNENDFDCVIDCRGVGAQTLSEHGDGPQIRGVRGEVLWVHTDEVKLSRPVRLMHPRYKLYVVPKPHQRFIIGATEIESADNSPMSVQSAMELCSALYTLNPAFAEARIEEMDTNLRPATPDNMPLIDSRQLPCGRKVLHINGLYRHGYLLAPYIISKAEGLLFAKTPAC